jgi:hypothetical protein
MKSSLRITARDHPSYRLHRKQLWLQILLPILLSVLIVLALAILTGIATFRDQGDVGRWAAISTIWLTLPVIIAGVILLALVIVLIYLVSQITSRLPIYSHQTQQIFYRIEGGVKRYAEMFRKPMLALKELTRLGRAYIDNMRKARTN